MSGERHPPFAVSEFTLWHQSFEEDVELLLRAGVDAIEVCERKLSRDPGEARAQLAHLQASGLAVCSIQPRVHALFADTMTPEIHDPDERAARYRDSIDLFAEFFPGVPMVTITGNAPDHDYRRAHRTARRLYPELADYAAERGTSLMFEPLNPILMNNDTFIASLDAGMELIERVDRPNFGLMLDVWHVWHEPLIRERVAALTGRILGVHLSDWPPDEPRAPGDRAVPGEGVIDLPGLLAAIEASGYRGAYCLELFSADHLPDSLWRLDPGDLVERSRRGFQAAWEARHARG